MQLRGVLGIWKILDQVMADNTKVFLHVVYAGFGDASILEFNSGEFLRILREMSYLKTLTWRIFLCWGI